MASSYPRANLPAFIAENEPVLLGDEELRRGLAELASYPSPGVAPAECARTVLAQLTQNAEASLRLIEGHHRQGARLLELGGGIGLTNAWLQHNGVDVVSLEPSLGGHELQFELGRRLLRVLGLDAQRWLPLQADQAPQLGRSFDLIFSNYVLEHDSNLERSLERLAECLHTQGLMRHSCPNYLVPYEPHLGLPLVPLWPRLTERLAPRRTDSELWRGLRFLNSFALRRLARDCGLEICFDPGLVHASFLRMARDPGFAGRNPLLARLANGWCGAGLAGTLRWIPASLATPLWFSLFPSRLKQASRLTQSLHTSRPGTVG